MIANWVIIGMCVLIGLFLLKMEHHTRKIKVISVIIIGFILYFSIVGMFTSEQVDLSSSRGVVNAVYLYFGWIGQTATNLWDIGTNTVDLVGNAIKINNSDESFKKR